jgi:hypothetical protein
MGSTLSASVAAVPRLRDPSPDRLDTFLPNGVRFMFDHYAQLEDPDGVGVDLPANL